MALVAASWERTLAIPLLGNPLSDWLETLGITLLVLLTALLLKRVLRRRFARPGAPTSASSATTGSAPASTRDVRT